MVLEDDDDGDTDKIDLDVVVGIPNLFDSKAVGVLMVIPVTFVVRGVKTRSSTTYGYPCAPVNIQ